MRTPAFLLPFVIAVAACQPPSPPVPLACIDDTTVYARADTSNGVIMAVPRTLVAPSGTLGHPDQVTVAVLVGVNGRPERGRTRILVSGGTSNDQLALDLMRGARFTPATRGGCAVRSWFELSMRRT